MVDPVLRALGWEVEDIEQVRREYKTRRADKPVDYALFVARTPELFIEAKALGENLDDRRWAHQIIGYAMVAGAKWTVLTDGDEYRIYKAHAEVPFEEKLFRTVRVSNEDSQVEQTLLLLSRARMADGNADALWRAEFTDRQVRSAIEALFVSGANPSLVRLIRKEKPQLSTASIQTSLGRVNVRLDFRSEPPGLAHSRTSIDKGARRHQRTRVRQDASLQDLIQAALINPPLELEKTYKGHRLTARVERDGTVTSLGKTYDSLSTAAGMARFSVIGAPAGRKYPQTNGWTFWSFRDSASRLISMDLLRQQYVKTKRRQHQE
jgi:hypothetical protein